MTPTSLESLKSLELVVPNAIPFSLPISPTCYADVQDSEAEGGADKKDKGPGKGGKKLTVSKDGNTVWGHSATSEIGDWVDETKVTAAERAWNGTCCALRTAAQEVVQSCQAGLNEFRALPERQSYAAEMGLVLRRSQWVEAFLGQEKNGQTLALLIQEQKEGAQTAPEAEATPAAVPDSKTTTADFGAVSRAAPCACWQRLETLSDLMALGAEFKKCKNMQDIKKKKDELMQKKGYANDLVSAAKGAVNDMITAKKRADQAQKRQEEKAKKEAEKRKQEEPMKRRKKKVGKHALINAEDESSFQNFPRFSPLRFDVTQPFIYRPTPRTMDGLQKSSAKEFGDFREVFKSSNLRVTEGKATRIACSEVADAFVKEVQMALSCIFAVGYIAEKDPAEPAPGSGSQDAGAGGVTASMVEKVMKPQWFGMVPDHVSLGRYEAGLLPMIKWVAQGTFLCSVVTCDELIAKTDMRTGDLQAKVTSKTDTVAKESFFMGTLGPGDFLYVPAGALASVQANRGFQFEVCRV
ncbi:unnamed protein product [Symbiodinium sp. CCMP2592]|nr:unnamed protein product [Symbiodinium sp. CCMP2592]